jgi:hypothetical protein
MNAEDKAAFWLVLALAAFVLIWACFVGKYIFSIDPPVAQWQERATTSRLGHGQGAGSIPARGTGRAIRSFYLSPERKAPMTPVR